jgi:hypothetical protein
MPCSCSFPVNIHVIERIKSRNRHTARNSCCIVNNGQNTRNWHTATGFLLQEPCDQKAIFSIYAAETGNENSQDFGRMDFEKNPWLPTAHPFKDFCRLELFFFLPLISLDSLFKCLVLLKKYKGLRNH